MFAVVTGASAEPPTEAPHAAPKRVASRVLVHTGDGKGKSTAAMGTAIRAVARGWRVCVVQFVKSGRWKTGEEASARRLGIDWWSIGDGFTWNSRDMDRTEAIAREAWRSARELIRAGGHELIVLDEITYPLNWDWIDADDVLGTIGARPPHVNVILTGRDAPVALCELADTVTEMIAVKHAFDAGIAGTRGIEF